MNSPENQKSKINRRRVIVVGITAIAATAITGAAAILLDDRNNSPASENASFGKDKPVKIDSNDPSKRLGVK